jgi:uncharacterized protein (DUF433 family)
MSTGYPHLIGAGIYSVAEAARLTRVSSACIRRWLSGYLYKTSTGPRTANPVFAGALPLIDGELALSFLDLIEVRIVNSLRSQKISWKLIRLAEANAREIFKVDHPFATRKFKIDGRRIFAELRKEHGERPLVDLADNQLTFRAVVEPYLKDIDFDSKDRAAIWRPMGARHRILLDPRRSFGQPIVSEGVPTAVLARAVKREGSIEEVASWYEVEPRAVRDAVEFERKLAA